MTTSPNLHGEEPHELVASPVNRTKRPGREGEGAAAAALGGMGTTVTVSTQDRDPFQACNLIAVHCGHVADRELSFLGHLHEQTTRWSP